MLHLGVYQGRDLAICATMMQERGYPAERQLCGVDLFLDVPMPDWMESEIEQVHWSQAMGIDPPSLEKTLANLRALGLTEYVEVVQADAVAFCNQAAAEGRAWDCVYVDTAHDAVTTEAHIRAAVPVAKKLLAGDDYDKMRPTWGVQQAVIKCFRGHEVVRGYCWLAAVEDYIPPLTAEPALEPEEIAALDAAVAAAVEEL